MLAALIIVFREVFEAGLIIGIVMAVTRGVALRGWWIGSGVVAGLFVACIIAAFAGALSTAFEGFGQELFNAAILGVAVVMLTWHNVWMARHGREMATELRAAGTAVVAGTKSLTSLTIVVAVAVLREGFEVVLFLFGVITSQGGSLMEVVLGSAAGIGLASLVCLLTYAGLVAISARLLFGATSILIAFLAAGMAAQAVAFLEQANLITALDTLVWDTSDVLSDKSLVGRTLHTLIGYSDHPTAMQLTIYAATLAVMFLLMKLLGSEPPRQAQPVQSV